MARTLQPYALKTTIEVDNAKGSAALKQIEKDTDAVGKRFQKLGPEITKSMQGAEKAGQGFGKSFSAGATTVITGSMTALGQTLGAVIGTAIAPGIGTAIGSTLGSGIDSALQKISGPIMQTIAQGIDLNKEIEKATVHFTAFGGSEIEAAKHLKELKALSLSSGLDLRDLIQGSERLEEFSGKLGDTALMLKAAAAASIVFGKGAEGFNTIADALGRMTQVGELTGKMLLNLQRTQGVPATRYLAQAFGYTEKQVLALIKAGKIRGDVAAQIIAESTIRDKGPRAAAIMQGTTYGAEQKFGASVAQRGQEGTVSATKGLKDFYQQAFSVLQSPEAQKFVAFLDQTAGSVINLVEKGLKTGLSLTTGIAKGMASGEGLQAITGAGESIIKSLEGFFVIKSPSELMAIRLGEPMGEGIGLGMVRGFKRFFSTDLERAFLKILASSDLREKLDAASEKYGVPRDLLAAVMAQESRGNPRAVSPKGAKGLMQFMPGTAGAYGIRGREFDPASSIDAGAHLLSDLLKQSGGNIPGALAHYNWSGKGRMPQETKDYVRLITGLLGGGGGASVATTAGVPLGGDNLGGEIARLTKLTTQTNDAAADVFERINRLRATLGLEGSAGSPLTPKAGVYPRALNDEEAKLKQQAIINLATLEEIYQRFVKDNERYQTELSDLYKKRAAAEEARSLFVGPGESWQRGGGRFSGLGASPQDAGAALPKLDEGLTVFADDVRDLTYAAKQADPAVTRAGSALAMIGVGLPPIMKGVNDAAGALAENALGADALINQSAAEIRKAGIETASMANQVAGMIGQVSGMIPSSSGTVGKKRGLFGKILGFASPFLSLVPGIGPILSLIAGAASQGLAGNYGGMVGSIAGGFTSQGGNQAVFHFGGGSAANAAAVRNAAANFHRAGGGPVRVGRSYRVGERGEETFIPDQNGQIIPHGAGGLHPTVLSVLSEMTAEVRRLRSFPPDHIVAKGAAGLLRAMDGNAKLSENMGRRLQLA